ADVAAACPAAPVPAPPTAERWPEGRAGEGQLERPEPPPAGDQIVGHKNRDPPSRALGAGNMILCVDDIVTIYRRLAKRVPGIVASVDAADGTLRCRGRGIGPRRDRSFS